MADRGYRGRPTRAERLINEGHSRGLDQALSDTEARIRDMKTERAYVFDKNGKELSRSAGGSSNKTHVTMYEDSIVTHNHPYSKGLGSSLAGRIWVPLSGTDIYSAISTNVAEIRAVTGTYTYSLKRPKGGWGMTSAQAKKEFGVKKSEWSKKVTAAGEEYAIRSGKRGRLYDAMRRGENIQKEAIEYNDRINVGTQVSVMKEYAKKYGWSFTRKKTR